MMSEYAKEAGDVGAQAETLLTKLREVLTAP
jgi:hypothetical protein